MSATSEPFFNDEYLTEAVSQVARRTSWPFSHLVPIKNHEKAPEYIKPTSTYLNLPHNSIIPSAVTPDPTTPSTDNQTTNPKFAIMAFRRGNDGCSLFVHLPPSSEPHSTAF